MRMTVAALVLVSTSVLAVPTGAIASSPGQHQTPGHGQTKCKNDGHKYIFGKTATAHGKQTKFAGTLKRFHPCGEDDGYFTGTKTIKLTLKPASMITVFKKSEDPSNTKTVTATQFPHTFKKNMDEPFYRFTGPKSAVKKLSEHFVS